ncbi:MAG: hypothetical protein IJC02_04055 [Lachnospiraceae bacterium]|nr:hypothetical protein [Lachnospiraceae bacterium]
MSSEMVRRLKVAGDYQRKAIKALFPEEMGGHLDVIEREVKAMFVELAMEIGKEYKETTEENKKTKKVDIE